jgi:hypothetical protein
LSLSVLFSMASAAVARAAARESRARLRELILDMERLASEHEGLLVRLRRVEGRQTARIGRDGPKPTDDGLPDPTSNPEAWRAAIRWRAAQAKANGEMK